MKLAIDAMGGDYAPEKIVQGVELARDEYSDVHFILFGKEDKIKKYLKNATRITIVHTDSEIAMGDEPVRAVRQKKTSSLVLAAQSVKEGKADALFSAGNTGALLAASLFIIGRIKGVDRPGMTTTLPALEGAHDSFTMLDVGANAESKVKNLQQFAVLGNFYSTNVMGVTNPRIALLNNGAEEDKGDPLHKETYQTLKDDPNLNFVGNIESRELLNGKADVVVTDGFTGNAVLKNTEGTALSMLKLLKHTILDSGIQGKLGGLLLKPAFKIVQNKMDYSKHGGAVLLGVKAPVVKAHGSSNEIQVYHALRQLCSMVNSSLTKNLADYFATRPTDKN
ncbi:phosphate acyltransferase PlsX [Pediococcus ethanolidurans]|uniref:phosphate acyltransferase PlsX n=1 Tax=Pediococcus ethanolidurans TaxID=319653 RepID=UPI001C1EEA0D|nr:phosphate acyltransferase PlsX [Pediococcus ethanolidurans]MBU7554526.1 phosphate acyltransferase PlsX [Pediococcus ethanolidurans]MBU7563101.1 phosphate acyltransferase PlsX [Pediococcus ethanolidurans]MCT4397177.1 phosphate acyltransferase PlsX [Pediococcus ethanolidurans]MCV3315081.1 phosphate acyltransferase PlsX [Pediococcus ethanolidurans]MCV3320861.1 phosphate acyltransferase PlsX [Pediococcus ethanolidurans]